MAFTPVPSALDLVELERVLERWRTQDVPKASVGAARRSGCSTKVPRQARPGIHHVGPRVQRPVPAYTMRGRYVARKGGGTARLPVEVEVEKALGIKNKHEIEEFGIEAFNQRCRELVRRYVEDWAALTGRIGMWIDTADAYWTLNNEYIESVWWIVRQMWDRGLVYEGSRLCRTAVGAGPRCRATNWVSPARTRT